MLIRSKSFENDCRLNCRHNRKLASSIRCVIHRPRYTFYFFYTRQTVNLHIWPDPNNKWVSENLQIVLYYSIMYIIRLWVAASRPLQYAYLDFRLSRSLSIMLIVVTTYGRFSTSAIYYRNLTTTGRTSSTFLCHLRSRNTRRLLYEEKNMTPTTLRRMQQKWKHGQKVQLCSEWTLIIGEKLDQADLFIFNIVFLKQKVTLRR